MLEGLRILVVDDEEDVRRGVERLLRGTGATVAGAPDGETALARMEEAPADVVVTDVRMPGISGVDLLREVRARRPSVEVILLTGFGTIETAVACLQAGAAHFLTKPFENARLVEVVERAGLRALARRRPPTLGPDGRRPFVAVDPKMKDVLAQVARVGPLRVPVLVEGRSGTGKELVARAVHESSPGRDRPFLAVNCAALPDTLLESELFGHKKGAFTGAHRDHDGLFRQAQGGTVFLDEIASMSLPFQGKLLRVLEERRVRPLGADRDEPVDFRLVAATNRDLAAMIARGQFREDLYYRLRVMTIRLPSLAERKADVPALAAHFVERATHDLLGPRAPVATFSPAALEEMLAHPWPGNVRELENAVQQAVVAAEGGTILPHHLRLGATEWGVPDEDLSYDEGKQRAVERFQRRYLLAALDRAGGNVTRAAAACGMTRAALQRILRSLGVDRADFADDED
ncbi:MAG: sigma-54-dependent Fis family transcriptional regulator [Planctomycetes bacterium]|nr:sigma-54-dependent Fis family transcriptional regulator [Planctomycetota bacterium]